MAHIEKRLSKKGAITYRVQIRIKGDKPTHATFRRLTDARKWAQDTESAIRDGKYFPIQNARRHTVQQLVTKFVQDILEKGTKRYSTQKNHLKWWETEIGHMTLDKVTSLVISECRDKLSHEAISNGQKRKPATVNRYLGTFSTAISTAVREWGWLEKNPMINGRVRKKIEPLGRVRFLSDDERKHLLKACKDSGNNLLFPIVITALSTGMRLGELMTLDWADVDLKKGWIVLEHTKNNERRGVPLQGAALECLKELSKVRRINTKLIFPNRRGDGPAEFRRSWLKALEEAKIQDFKFHDLRHSAASYLAMNGATLLEIADILGHRTLEMVKRYSHLADDHKAKVVASMNKKFLTGENS